MKTVNYPCNSPIFSASILECVTNEKINSSPEIIQSCLIGVFRARLEIQPEDSLVFSMRK
jgi:hypothetical protein